MKGRCRAEGYMNKSIKVEKKKKKKENHISVIKYIFDTSQAEFFCSLI